MNTVGQKTNKQSGLDEVGLGVVWGRMGLGLGGCVGVWGASINTY